MMRPFHPKAGFPAANVLAQPFDAWPPVDRCSSPVHFEADHSSV